jgi:hypothetical protein
VIESTCSSSVSFISCSVNAPGTLNGTAVQGSVEIKVARDLSTQALPERGAGLGQAALTLALTLPMCRVGRRRWSGSRLRLLSVLSSVLLSVVLSVLLSGCALGGNCFTIPTGQQVVTVRVSAAGTTLVSEMTVNVTP